MSDSQGTEQEARREQHRDQYREQAGGPRVSGEQMRDVGRLRRSASDRYVAGVAGGLGRHFDIDPTLIRVVLAVLTLFGGAGLLVYVAVWVLVPEDGEEKAPVDLRPDIQRALLVTAAVVALLIVFGTPFANSGWGWGFPFPVLVVGLIGLWIYTLVRRDKQPPPPPWNATSPPPGTPAAQEGSTMSYTETQQLPTQPESPHQPPAWMPPTPPAYVPPPRPRRTGLVLFWPTLALIGIGLGILGMIDVNYDVYASAYAVLALTIVAVMLLVGAFVGRPGGLIALGLVGALGLGVTSIADSADGFDSDADIAITPTTASELRSSYDYDGGNLVLDLRDVTDVTALDGRAVDVSLGAGEITVVLPPTLNADVDARLDFAGEIVVDDEKRGGVGDMDLQQRITNNTQPGAPTIQLNLDNNVGEITVRTEN